MAEYRTIVDAIKKEVDSMRVAEVKLEKKE